MIKKELELPDILISSHRDLITRYLTKYDKKNS